MQERTYFVYMLASKPYGTLYTGVTNDLIRRVWEHREGIIAGFTTKRCLSGMSGTAIFTKRLRARND